MKTWQLVKRDLLKKPGVAKEYKALEPEYQLIAQLIEARTKKGLSQADLARKIGTRQSAVSRFESGNYNPTFRFLKKVADATGSKVVVRLESH